jgi:hypothetical protein
MSAKKKVAKSAKKTVPLTEGEKIAEQVVNEVVEEVKSKPHEKVNFTCVVCGGSKTAFRMNGKARLHETEEGEVICHFCWEKIRKNDDDEKTAST